MTSLTSFDLGLTVAFSVIVLTNIIGNSLVCLVVSRFNGMRAPINFLLLNLAVSDMMVAISITPQYIIKWTFQHPNGAEGDYLCKFLTGGNFLWVGQAASTFSLVAIAFERYIAVRKPLNSRWQLTDRRLEGLIISSWIYAVLVDFPLFFVVCHKDGVSYCVEHWSNEDLGIAYTIACFFIFGAIPTITMVYLYSRVLCIIWPNNERATLISQQTRIRARRKVTKMVIVVSVMYAACRLPNLVVYMLTQLKPDLGAYGSKTYVASVVLVGFNSAMNPFIYALQSTNFRRHIKGALCCRTYRSADFVRVK